MINAPALSLIAKELKRLNDNIEFIMKCKGYER